MSQKRRLSALLLLNMAMITGLVTVGLTAHSLAVLAAGGDFAADSLAIALGLMAVYMRDSRGSKHATTYVAFINGVLLLCVSMFVLAQAIERLLTQSPEVHGLPVLIVSAISTLVMGIGVIIVGNSAGKEDLHMRSVLLDTISDGLSAAGVTIVGAVIYFTHGLYWLDAASAAIISVVIGLGAVRLLRDVFKALHSKQYLEIDTK